VKSESKRQFNVTLPPELIYEVKHAAVDARKTLSDFVEDALRAHLASLRAQDHSRGDDAPDADGLRE
jgi:hypothetical protein